MKKTGAPAINWRIWPENVPTTIRENGRTATGLAGSRDAVRRMCTSGAAAIGAGPHRSGITHGISPGSPTFDIGSLASARRASEGKRCRDSISCRTTWNVAGGWSFAGASDRQELRDQLAHHLAVHVGQPEIAAGVPVDQPFMIE